MLLYAELNSGILSDRLSEAVGLVGVRADDELEAVLEWTVEFLPIRSPDVAIVDLNETFAGNTVQICIERVGMRYQNRFAFRKQSLQRTIVGIKIPTMIDKIIEIECSRFICKLVAVYFGTNL